VTTEDQPPVHALIGADRPLPRTTSHRPGAARQGRTGADARLRSLADPLAPELVRALLAEAMLDAVDSPVAVIDTTGHVLATNEAWERLAGLNGVPWVEVGHDYRTACEDLALGTGETELLDTMLEILAGRSQRGGCEYAVAHGARRAWFRMSASRHVTSGQVFVVVRHDPITAERESHSAVAFRSMLLDEVDAAVISIDDAGVIDSWNGGAERTFGWTSDEAVGCDLVALLVDPERAGQARLVQQRLREVGRWEGQLAVLDRAGNDCHIEARLRTLRDDDGEPTGSVLVAVDNAERLEMERRVVRANARLTAVTERMGEGLCTLDGGGRITYVNPHGQQLLGGPQARSVGGSFVNRLVGLRADGSCPSRGEQLIGGTFAGDLPTEPTEDLLVRPDGSQLPIEYVASALADRPDGPTDGWVVVFRDVSARQARNLALERQAEHTHWMAVIDEALTHDHLVLFAQPILELATGRVVTHELLLRIDHPDHGLLVPGQFLPTAERFGLVPSIDRWVIAKGIELAATGMHVEINLSARTLEDRSVADLIAVTLARSGVDPGRVGFELTETAMLGNDDQARRFAEQVRALGCRLALDDFGTGYGGLSYLKHLPVDSLKIDREFVADAITDPASRRVITAVVGLAKAFDLSTVGEGVEDEATAQLLRELGVDRAQGYLFGRPAPVRAARDRRSDLRTAG
jgi:PAS domain S-box-containing protein